jgi:hypothetical protein
MSNYFDWKDSKRNKKKDSKRNKKKDSKRNKRKWKTNESMRHTVHIVSENLKLKLQQVDINSLR